MQCISYNLQGHMSIVLSLIYKIPIALCMPYQTGTLVSAHFEFEESFSIDSSESRLLKGLEIGALFLSCLMLQWMVYFNVAGRNSPIRHN